jgi:hypothetical protein
MRPYFSDESIFSVRITTDLASLRHFFKYSLASMPRAFSALSVVRDSGVSIPARRTRDANKISNPKSIITSMVSPSTTFFTYLQLLLQSLYS